jgi:ribosomal protein L34
MKIQRIRNTKTFAFRVTTKKGTKVISRHRLKLRTPKLPPKRRQDGYGG